jgi:hypothetical protein
LKSVATTSRFAGLPGTSVGMWLCGVVLIATAGSAERDGVTLFRTKIEPVLKAHCYSCHSQQAEKVASGLRLDSPGAMLRGGDSGPALVRGQSQGSLLLQAIRHEGGLAMPPKQERLADEVIADFARWIDAGAIDPRQPAVEEDSSREFQTQAARRHWAFQPVRKVAPAQVSDKAWPQSPLDRFVLAKLEELAWRPAPTAERTERIRRLSFDLTGLPPTPEEIDEFVLDSSPDAYSRLVDRLLGSPRCGERAAVHWFDVVRFAESEGFEYDGHIPDAWRYRDYVIESFNADKPFDRFLREQVAGDEIDPDNPACRIATAFHRLGPVRRNAGNPEIALSRNEVLTERTDIFGTAFLALTIGCSRCHNHKLEPISQQDYYRFQAYLAATAEDNIVLASAEEQRVWEERTKQAKAEIDALKAKLKSAQDSEKLMLEAQIESLEDRLPGPLATIPAIRNDWEKRTPIHVLRRGVWQDKGDAVGLRPLSILIGDDVPELPADTPNPRTRLAEWLSSPQHPLTARVIVNRLWQQHFGAGIVKNANDFGLMSDRPSHPELLDDLAAALVEKDWRLKPVHRSIVLSSSYQQSGESAFAAPYQASDPQNRLLWHFARRRLSAEEVRDAMLAVSGRLNSRAGGPSVMIDVDPELVNLLYKPSQWVVAKDVGEHDRRSVYLFAKRNLRLPFLESLDAPTLTTSCAHRLVTTSAPQALELLNGRLSNDLARSFADRLRQESQGDRERLIDRAFRLALGRPPTAEERAKSRAFLDAEPVAETTLSEFTLALFNLHGFLYVR